MTTAIPAAATIIKLHSTLDGAQANAGAGTGSPGTGSATMFFDDASNAFSWDLSWQNTIGAVLDTHFHGPALPNQNVGIQVGISTASNPTMGNAILSAAQASYLLAGLWYINIHTTVT